jgi:Uma2 family endonuclease
MLLIWSRPRLWLSLAWTVSRVIHLQASVCRLCSPGQSAILETRLYDLEVRNPLSQKAMPVSLTNLSNALPADEQRLVLEGVTWQQYDALVALFINQFPALRMTYLEGTLELMTTSPEHERLKKIIARLIEAFAEESDLDLNGYGSATFRKEAAARGLEPDECYCLGELHEVPDIAIEIVLTSGGIDKLAVYQGLGVKEVWFWDNQRLQIYNLVDGEQGYEALTRSPLLPQLDVALLTSFVDRPDQTRAVKQYRLALKERIG